MNRELISLLPVWIAGLLASNVSSTAASGLKCSPSVLVYVFDCSCDERNFTFYISKIASGVAKSCQE